jgi:ribosomal protein L21E
LGTDLRMSTSYHPQSDGQTERLIKELEHQLRTFANHMGTSWKDCLPVAEMHYNSDVHDSTGKTPYEMNGVDWKDTLALALQKPTSQLTSEGAQQLIDSMKSAWEDARQVMLKRREQQKKYADRSRREERYQVGDLVMLSTENLAVGRGKLSDRYVGPFQVAEVRENGVNVRLNLPKQFSRIHPVFHVEKLKRFLPSTIDWPGRAQRERPPPVIVDGRPQYWAVRILGKKEKEIEELVREVDIGANQEEDQPQQDDGLPQPSAKRRSPRGHSSSSTPLPTKRVKKNKAVKIKRMVVLYLVEWEGYGSEAATWEREDQLIHDGAQPLIDEYNQRQLEVTGQVELVVMYLYEPRRVNGVVDLACVRL